MKMWRDGNHKIEELYNNLQGIKKFPTICPYAKRMPHTYICTFMKKGREGAGYGFGVVNAIHFLTVQSMYQNIGETVHWWKKRNYVLYQII
ncbi:MAG: hypothetical protein HDR05_13455 [Lachnospiraceae bacterium]|nr:hypothetical protein [Lachnospiraceae bacterium]